MLRCAKAAGTAAFRRVATGRTSADDELHTLDPTVRADAEARARSVMTIAADHGLHLMAFGDADYPALLAGLEDPPPVLFTIGRTELLSRPAVAIVGTREATAYGVRVTRQLAWGASQDGVCVVSGLARGVDAQAHDAALRGVGRTIAVLGTGVDVPYPVENALLYRRIAEHGLLVSEALPGARAHPGSFPRRNRLIAALADVTLVTEAGARSGALITVAVAVAIGRIHAAVPGPVDMPSSLGSNLLLRDGAQVVTSVGDLLGLVDLTTRGRARERRSPPAPAGTTADDGGLGDEESRVLALVRAAPRLPDELLAASGLPPATLAAALATLGVLGLAEVDPGGVVRPAGC